MLHLADPALGAIVRMEDPPVEVVKVYEEKHFKVIMNNLSLYSFQFFTRDQLLLLLIQLVFSISPTLVH